MNDQLEHLIIEFGNAAFDCGAWADDDDEPYTAAENRFKAARSALVQAIEELETPRRGA